LKSEVLVLIISTKNEVLTPKYENSSAHTSGKNTDKIEKSPSIENSSARTNKISNIISSDHNNYSKYSDVFFDKIKK